MLEKLKTQLEKIPSSQTVYIAYSGGLDSHVLLHCLAQLWQHSKKQLYAVHINHGLSPHADSWAAHCRKTCESLNIPIEIITVNAKASPGESPEAAARDARYAALAEFITPGSCLFTAHHRDDQAETLLLQLFRGAGVNGLASMPMCRSFGAAMLCRPLLAFSRAELLEYAQSQQWQWCDDDSNTDLTFDRNLLRHELLPAIEKNWQGLKKNLARTAENLSEAKQCLEALAESDYASVKAPGSTLNIPKLLRLSVARQNNLLRYWLRDLKLPIPSQTKLHHIRSNILHARQDASPLVHWQGAEVRRYRQSLFAMPPLLPIDTAMSFTWDLQNPLLLPGDLGRLTAEQVLGKGLDLKGHKAITIRFRQGGERIELAGREGTHSLKKLFQEWGIPPWQRDRIPLLYADNELIAVPDRAIKAGHLAESGQIGVDIGFEDCY